jgi:hypothetical protein
MKKQTVLYIAGPMSGIADLNYPLFNDTEVALFDLGYDVRNPANIDNMFPIIDGEERDHPWYMRRALPMLCEADGICILPGWLDSKGAKGEVQIAQDLLGIPTDYIAFVDVWRRRADRGNA